MPRFGLSKPFVAKYIADGQYTGGLRCGRAVSTSVTPNYASGGFNADNQQTEDVNEFRNAAVNLGVDTLPIIVAEIFFGHKITEDKEEISNGDDAGNYVGYGFITTEINDNKKTYGACVILKVKFVEGEESYETKGDSITFTSPTLSGTAVPITNKDWRKRKFFDTEEEAEAYIQGILNITPTCETPVISVAGGTYSGTQTVAIGTQTEGATIYYTTNGLTPSELMGTAYTGEITVAESTLLKAIAVKSGYSDSQVATAEYIITA